MTTPAGELLVLGINLRSYDAKKKTWNMKWLNALGGTSPVANGAGRGIAKVGRKGAISAVLLRIVYRFVALQMKIFPHYRERTEMGV